MLPVTTTSSMVVVRSYSRMASGLCPFCQSRSALSYPMQVTISCALSAFSVVKEKRPSESVRQPSVVPLTKTLAPAIGWRPSVTVPDIICCAWPRQWPDNSRRSMSMLRFMPAKLAHETQRCKFVGQTANYGAIRLCVWTKCKDLGRMTKQKSGITCRYKILYLFLRKNRCPHCLYSFWNTFFLLYG